MYACGTQVNELPLASLLMQCTFEELDIETLNTQLFVENLVSDIADGYPSFKLGQETISVVALKAGSVIADVELRYAANPKPEAQNPKP